MRSLLLLLLGCGEVNPDTYPVPASVADWRKDAALVEAVGKMGPDRSAEAAAWLDVQAASESAGTGSKVAPGMVVGQIPEAARREKAEAAKVEVTKNSGGGPPATPPSAGVAGSTSERDDAVLLCKAVTECEACDDAAQDRRLAVQPMSTPWGKATQASMQRGNGIAAETQYAFVRELKRHGAESDLDCSIVALAWNPETARAIEEAMAGVPDKSGSTVQYSVPFADQFEPDTCVLVESADGRSPELAAYCDAIDWSRCRDAEWPEVDCPADIEKSSVRPR